MMKERKIYKTEGKKERNMDSERKIERMNRKTDKEKYIK